MRTTARSSIPTTKALATVFREGTNVSTDLVVTLGKGTTGADIP